MTGKEWLKDIDLAEVVKRIGGDSKLVYEHCGEDVLLSLISKLPSVEIYISRKLLTEARKMYIRQNFTGNNHKQLALKLGASEQFVRDVLAADKRRKSNANEPDLFAGGN